MKTLVLIDFLLLFSSDPDTLEPTITGEDLIFEYHKLEPHEEEERKMHVESKKLYIFDNLQIS